MRERIAKQLPRQLRGGNELQKSFTKIVLPNDNTCNVGGWSGSVITLVHKDTRRLCYAIFLRGLAPFGSRVLSLQTEYAV